MTRLQGDKVPVRIRLTSNGLGSTLVAGVEMNHIIRSLTLDSTAGDAVSLTLDCVVRDDTEVDAVVEKLDGCVRSRRDLSAEDLLADIIDAYDKAGSLTPIINRAREFIKTV